MTKARAFVSALRRPRGCTSRSADRSMGSSIDALRGQRKSFGRIVETSPSQTAGSVTAPRWASDGEVGHGRDHVETSNDESNSDGVDSTSNSDPDDCLRPPDTRRRKKGVERLSVGPDVHAWETLEGGFVGADHEQVEGFGGGRDDEVVRAARFALRAHLDQESRVGLGNVEVVVENGDGGDDVVDVLGPRGLMPAVGEEGTDSKFGHGDRRDGHVVVVIDDGVEITSGSFGVDEERGVEQ